MRWIVYTSLRFRYLVIFAAAALMIFGIARLSNTSVDVFPEFAPPKVEIQTLSMGLSAAALEELVTVQLEHALNGIPGLDVMRSRSVPVPVGHRPHLQAGDCTSSVHDSW